MKNVFLFAAMLFLGATDMMAQTQYAVVTSIESIIPAGLGRSRMIVNKEDLNTANFTTVRTDGVKSDMGTVKREDLKIDNFEETKLLNFFSATGINFQNVASNDAIIAAKLNEMAAVGWELAFVTTGVESEAGTTDGEGIFVTRYIFKR
ncbi:MAG: hypothetical protein IPN60_07000 [Saprospiraceae bacterium]|nr:hypothetical protein [Candidatus Opimibacter skivensis]